MKKIKIIIIFALVIFIVFEIKIRFDKKNNDKCFFPQSIEINEFFIYPDELPLNWVRADIGSAVENRGDINAGNYYQLLGTSNSEPPLISENIYIFSKIKQAKIDYKNDIVHYLAYKEDSFSFKLINRTADEKNFFCNELNCLWVARYDCLVVEILGEKEYIEEFINIIDEFFKQ